MKRNLSALLAILVAGAFLLAACDTDADVASANLSKAAEQFEIERRVVFMNGITDQYMLEIIGRCSIEDQGTQLEVTCKRGPNEFTKDFLGLSDNVTYFVQQLGTADVDEYHYRVIFKPEAIVPDIDLETSGDE